MKNLLDFAGSFTSASWDYWSNCKLPSVDKIDYRDSSSRKVAISSFSIGDFESAVIDNITGWRDYRTCPEFILLNNYFKKGGKLSDPSLLYNKIDQIKVHNHYRGCDLLYAYAKNVLKGRLPSGAEDKFLLDLWKNHYGSRTAYKYAKYVIRGRLPVQHEKGCNDLDYLSFLEGKGVDISEILINSSTLSFYYYRKFCYLPEVVHNFMIAMQLSGDYYANIYFKQRNKDDRLIRGRLKMIDPSKTVSDVLSGLK